MNIKSEIVWRVGLVYVMFFIMSGIIFFKIFSLQLFSKKELAIKSTKIKNKSYVIQANRGNICAENGNLLACSLPYYELRMDLVPPALTDEIFYEHIDELSQSLADLFKDKSKNEYKKSLIEARKKRNRGFSLSPKLVSHKELKLIKTFPILKRGKYKGGLIVTKKSSRRKPYKKLAQRTIGYLNEDIDRTKTGKVGLEEAYETHLKGVEGINVGKIIAGRVYKDVQIEPIDGKDIVTSININFQDIVQTTLYEQLENFNAKYGCAILMEVETGEIKAISNLRFDEEAEEYIEDYNYAIGESNEPGSVFKLAAAIALLEDGYVDLDDIVSTGKGVTYFYGVKMTDTRKGGYGKISFKEVFEKSSNVGISTLVQKHYKKNPKRFINRLYDLHLNEPIGIKIKGEGKPSIKYPNDPTWSGISLPWMSIGYEIKLTPLHVLTLYNAIANKGKMIKPRLVKRISFHGKTIKEFNKPEVIDSRICSKETLQKLKILLEGVVENGTAKKIKTDKFKIAGKTGTAQIADKNKGYSQEKYRSSFVGFFPSDNPKYSCIVMVSNPDKTKGYYASTVAAPAFRIIADKIYASDIKMEKKTEKFARQRPFTTRPLVGNKEEMEDLFLSLGYKVDNNVKTNWVKTTAKRNKIVLNRKNVLKDKLPDVKGMGLKDAIYLLEKNNMKVKINKIGNKVNRAVIKTKKNEKYVVLEMI